MKSATKKPKAKTKATKPASNGATKPNVIAKPVPVAGYDGIHPAANAMPRMSQEHYADLVNDIKAHGQHDACITVREDDRELLLDGIHRDHACRQLGIAPRFERHYIEDPIAFVKSKNLHRRHLDDSQRAQVIVNLETLERERAPSGRFAQWTAPTRDKLAKEANVSERLITAARHVKKRGSPELVQDVLDGKVTVSKAEEQLRHGQRHERAPVGYGSGDTHDQSSPVGQPRSTPVVEASTAPWVKAVHRAEAFMALVEQYDSDPAVLDVFWRVLRWATALRIKKARLGIHPPLPSASVATPAAAAKTFPLPEKPFVFPTNPPLPLSGQEREVAQHESIDRASESGAEQERRSRHPVVAHSRIPAPPADYDHDEVAARGEAGPTQGPFSRGPFTRELAREMVRMLSDESGWSGGRR